MTEQLAQQIRNVHTFLTTYSQEAMHNDTKEVHSWKVPKDLSYNFKVFCAFLGETQADVVTYALIEYMERNLNRLPIHADFSVTFQVKEQKPEQSCEVSECSKPATVSAFYKSQPVQICVDHARIFGSSEYERVWRVVK